MLESVTPSARRRSLPRGATTITAAAVGRQMVAQSASSLALTLELELPQHLLVAQVLVHARRI